MDEASAETRVSVEDTQGDKATPRGDRESPEARKEGRQCGSLASGWKRCLERKPAVSRSGHTGAGGGAKLGLRISSGGELSLWSNLSRFHREFNQKSKGLAEWQSLPLLLWAVIHLTNPKGIKDWQSPGQVNHSL